MRHLEAAALLGADTRDATASDGGEMLAGRVIELMRAIGTPNGISSVGYDAGDIPALVDGVVPQQRLLGNAPCEITKSTLSTLFERAQRYW
jgi:alcohol dehydrogenase class IV